MKGLLIFDLDGTLLESRRHICKAARDTLLELGLPLKSDAEILSHLGEPSAAFCKSIAPEYPDPENFRSRFRENERLALSEDGKLFAGAAPLLQQLAGEGYRLAICSNASMEYIELALRATGIRRLFSAVASASEYPSKAQAVEKLLQQTPNEFAALIGDTSFDADAAAENRIPFIAARYGYGEGSAIGAAPFFADRPEDLAAQVRQLSVYAELYRNIRQNADVRCVGVNGVDTSGKSIFAQRFAAYLHGIGQNAEVVHLDDFHNPKALWAQGENEIDAYFSNAFDLQTLAEEVLIPLHQQRELHKTLTLLDLDSDAYTRKRRYDFDADTLVLLEGVLLYREPLVNLIDYKVFLEIGFAEVLRRAEARDVPKFGEQILQKYKTKYIPVQRRYLRQYRPGKISDCVVENSDPAFPVIVS